MPVGKVMFWQASVTSFTAGWLIQHVHLVACCIPQPHDFMIFYAVIWNPESLGRRRTRKWAHTRHKVSVHWSFGLTRHRLVLIPVSAEKLTFLHFTSIQCVPQFLRCQRQSYLWYAASVARCDMLCPKYVFTLRLCMLCMWWFPKLGSSISHTLRRRPRCDGGPNFLAPSGFRTPPVPHGMHVRMQMPQMPRVQPVHRVIHQELLKISILLEVVLNCSHLSHTCKYQIIMSRIYKASM